MRSSVKFIILEDNADDRKLIERELMKFYKNCQIKSSHAKEEFAELLNEFKPDVILSDYNLGAYTGIDILETFQEKAPETPFIIVTGTLDEETAINCLKQGAWDYVLKDKLYKLVPAIDRTLKVQKEMIKKKQAEEAIKVSEMKLRLVLDNSPFAVAVVDEEDQNIFYWSKSAIKMFGHTPKTTKEWYDLAYPDQGYQKNVIKRWKPFLVKAKESG